MIIVNETERDRNMMKFAKYDTKANKTRRICAGAYERIASDGRFVDVYTIELYDGKWWIAAADWDSRLYTDPLYTKSDAVAAADEMLAGI